MENTVLWQSVEKTDPRYTKQVEEGCRKYTSIAPYYQFKEATKQWGPYGAQWGIKNLRYDTSLLELMAVIQLHGTFFYPNNGEKVEFDLSVSSKIIYKNGNPDADFAKKMETNIKTKALSLLGFNADVFMGMFDDSEYINEVHQEIAEQEADEKDQKKLVEVEEYNQWKEKAESEYQYLNSRTAINTVFNQHIRKASKMGDKSAIRKFEKLKNERLEALKAANKPSKETA